MFCPRHERNRGQALRAVVEFAVTVAEMLHLKSVRLVLLVIEGVELVNGDLMKLVEVRPPFPAAAEIVVEVRIGALLAEPRNCKRSRVCRRLLPYTPS